MGGSSAGEDMCDTHRPPWCNRDGSVCHSAVMYLSRSTLSELPQSGNQLREIEPVTDTLLTREVEAIPGPAPRRSSRTLRNGLIIGGAAAAVGGVAAIGTANNGSDDVAALVHSTTNAAVKAEIIAAGEKQTGYSSWAEEPFGDVGRAAIEILQDSADEFVGSWEQGTT